MSAQNTTTGTNIIENIINGINKKNIWISCILAVFTSIGMSLSIKKILDLTLEYETLDVTSQMQVFWRNIFIGLSSNRLTLILNALLIAIIIYAGLSFKRTWQESLCLLGLGLLFAITKLNCYSYKVFGSIQYIFDFELTDDLVRYRIAWKLLAYTILIYFLIKDALEVIRQRFVQKQFAVITSADDFLIENSKGPNAASLLGRALLILIAWMPYFLIFYPGTSNEDTTIQLMEYYSIPSYIQTMSSVQAEDIFFTNHHPYFLTQIFGHFTDLGFALGDVQVGVAIFTLLQMCMLALVFAGCLNYLQYIGVTIKRIRIVHAFVMFLPIFPMYALIMVKDTPYAAFCLILILMMYEVERTDGQVLKNWKFDLGWFVTALLMMLTKVYGVYIMGVIFVFYAIKYWRKLVRVLLITLLPVFLFQYIYIGMVLPSLNVAPGGVQEALSVPIQQTARYVIQYPDEVTKEEKKAINAILPYKKIEKLYEPELSDKLKRKFNQEVTDEELKEYFRVWFEMGLKHPLCYIDATLNNTYSYFDVSKKSSLCYFEMNTYLQDHYKKYPPEEYSWLYIGNSEEMTDYRYVVNQLVLICQKIPGLNLFMSIGMLPFIVVCMLILNLSRGRRKYNIALLIPVLTVAICLLSPDNGNSRYVMPIFYSLPFLMVMLTVADETEIKIIGSKNNRK